MNDEAFQQAEDQAIDAALREGLGNETPPDLTAAVGERLRAAPPVRNRTLKLAAAALALLGLGVVFGVAMWPRDNGPAHALSQNPVDPVHVTSRTQLEALPADTKAVICTGLEDDEIVALLRLTSLEWLELRAVVTSPISYPNPVKPIGTITDDGLRHLASLRNLRTLKLRSQDEVGSKGLEVLVALANLERLELLNMPLTDEASVVLPKLRNLRALKIEGVTGFGAPTAQRIVGLRQLRELSLSLCIYLDPEWLSGLGKLTNLERLDLGWNGSAAYSTVIPPLPQPVRDDIFDEIVKLRRLRRLSLANSLITSAGISRIADLPLVELDLSSCQGLDANVVPELLRMKSLQKLVVRDCRNLGYAELEQLRALPKLKECIGDAEQLRK